MNSLLPPNASALERAAEQVMARVTTIPPARRRYCRGWLGRCRWIIGKRIGPRRLNGN